MLEKPVGIEEVLRVSSGELQKVPLLSNGSKLFVIVLQIIVEGAILLLNLRESAQLLVSDVLINLVVNDFREPPNQYEIH